MSGDTECQYECCDCEEWQCPFWLESNSNTSLGHDIEFEREIVGSISIAKKRKILQEIKEATDGSTPIRIVFKYGTELILSRRRNASA